MKTDELLFSLNWFWIDIIKMTAFICDTHLQAIYEVLHYVQVIPDGITVIFLNDFSFAEIECVGPNGTDTNRLLWSHDTTHCPHGLHPAKIMGGENKHTHINKKKICLK